MKVGILKEIKNQEYRVAMTPAGVRTLCSNNHEVFVQAQAGIGSGFQDQDYIDNGATIIEKAKTIFQHCDMLMHVKEPQSSEYDLIKENHILFTYLHLAAEQKLTDALVKSGATCIAYETVQTHDGRLPLLTPMSEVAGRMSVQQGAKYLEKTFGGCGYLLGGVTGVEPATVVVIGGGAVGINAATMACGLGAKVYILDINIDRLRYLSEIMPANCIPLMSNPVLLEELVCKAQLVIGAILVAGASATKLVTRDMLKKMRSGAVIVDVSIDQGGCFETSQPTTHDNPVYSIDNIVHYCVSNIPGAVAATSTMALTNVTLPYAVQIANQGVDAIKNNPEIKMGLNVANGKVTCEPVARAFEYNYTPVDLAI